jgi:4-amino-4-deoxy-L-arabinose transferase-like glycosyltransferase
MVTSPSGTSQLKATVAVDNEFSLSQPRWGIWVLAALLLPAVAIEMQNALTRPFWFDELFTVGIAALGTPSAIWQALLTGVDTHPPFFYAVTNLGTHLATNEQLAYRIPSLFGYFITLFCLYSFVERRVGFVGGLIAALVASLSGFHAYAVEARPYGLEVGFLALGLLCWQRLEASRWFGVPLGLFLAAAVASHYYAILAIPALFVAEALRMYRTREFRFAAWIPLACSITPVLAALPHMRVIAATYGAHFWSHATLFSLAQSYSELSRGGSITAGVFVILFAIMLARGLPASTMVHGLLPRQFVDRVNMEECVLAALLLCLPIETYFAAKVTEGGLIMRYVLPTVLGLAIATGFSITWLGGTARAMLLAVLIVSYVTSTVTDAKTVFLNRARSAAVNSPSPALERLLRDYPSPLPVVVSSAVDYLRLAHYARPELAARILALVDSKEALSAVGTDQVDISASLLRPYTRAKIEDFSAFRVANRHFLLFSTGTTFDWWPERLSQKGHIVRLRHEQGQNRLYEVELIDQEISR